MTEVELGSRSHSHVPTQTDLMLRYFMMSVTDKVSGNNEMVNDNDDDYDNEIIIIIIIT